MPRLASLVAVLVSLLGCGSSESPMPMFSPDSGAGAGGFAMTAAGGAAGVPAAGAGGASGSGGVAGMGTVEGTGGAPANASGGTGGGTLGGAGGSMQSGSGGSTASRPDAGVASDVMTTMPSDAGKADTKPSYSACLYPDTTKLNQCGRLDEYKQIQWARKDGYRCSVCTETPPTGGPRQVAGCLKAVRKPQPDEPDQDSSPILCVSACSECAY